MKLPQDLQPGFVLHSRRYRESSVIVSLFCREYGIVPAVARGVHGTKSNHKRALLQPFQPLQCRWLGKGELVTLVDVDYAYKAPQLTKQAMYCGFYINELLIRLLHRHDPHESIYQNYEKLLQDLQNPDLIEANLRQFELSLLDELGYGLSLGYDGDGELIEAHKHYYLTDDSQFYPLLETDHSESSQNAFPGRILLAIQSYNWHDPEALRYAKRLTRMALQPLLGARPLESRKLFRSLNNDT